MLSRCLGRVARSDTEGPSKIVRNQAISVLLGSSRLARFMLQRRLRSGRFFRLMGCRMAVSRAGFEGDQVHVPLVVLPDCRVDQAATGSLEVESPHFGPRDSRPGRHLCWLEIASRNTPPRESPAQGYDVHHFFRFQKRDKCEPAEYNYAQWLRHAVASVLLFGFVTVGVTLVHVL